MKKIKKIKEIKPHVTFVKEIKKDKEEIESLTSSEIPLSQQEVSSFSRSSNILGSETNVSSGASPSLERETSHIPRQANDNEDNSPLYKVGAFTEADAQKDRRAYTPVETIGSGPTMRNSEVGRDFAMGSSLSSYPDAQAVQNRLREDEFDDKGKKYDNSKMEGKSKGRKGHGYAWEEY